MFCINMYFKDLDFKKEKEFCKRVVKFQTGFSSVL